ncbi:hypothetical protein [Allorhizobium ampelinum]|uniref:hypothetical protein n=1 Tax=Allorhizobium ampelinum TaxID=3025782 RepID=UPI000B3FAAFB|nr:hypothetical protein [Allorhizobium ampelinum]NTA27408.1 hypothetical protein [Allorhizobium ampelinum]OVE94464.1 hypothetical protein B7W85_13005 [Allorhizobium ampelinum]
MNLPKSSFQDLIEALREEARESFVDTFPTIAEEDVFENEIADLLERVERLLLDIIQDGGKFADQAKSIFMTNAQSER